MLLVIVIQVVNHYANPFVGECVRVFSPAVKNFDLLIDHLFVFCKFEVCIKSVKGNLSIY